VDALSAPAVVELMVRVCSLVEELLKFATIRSEELNVPRDAKWTGSSSSPVGDPFP